MKNIKPYMKELIVTDGKDLQPCECTGCTKTCCPPDTSPAPALLCAATFPLAGLNPESVLGVVPTETTQEQVGCALSVSSC
jgi:hypothetical protein